MKKQLTIYIIVLFALACKKENNCFISSGKSDSQTTDLDMFSSIEINDFMDVSWKKSSEYKVEIQGGENFIPEISHEVNNGKLTLENNNGCKFLRRNVKNISVTVYCPSFDTLSVRGSGEINFQDTIQNNLWINCIANQGSMNLKIKNNYTKFYLESGSNEIKINGSTRYCNYYNSGINHFYAKSFEVDSFRCHSRSKGVTEINVKSWLHIEQNGDSDINYWGNPSIVNITSYLGNGDIINRD
ncbi:MAG: hypothetical protein CMD35_02575 [Flavobacteriales bacterium]|nr:hypothetical protein [Flavobacteriales bacterium]|tara:strand:- start:1438 stop:2166 length:729 start_codon:yes stop_codon:yes gene_type:complete